MRRVRADVYLLGGRFRFESHSTRLLKMVDAAYAGLPAHRLSGETPELRVTLVLSGGRPRHRRDEPPPLTLVAAPGLLGGVTGGANFVAVAAESHTALVGITPEMLRFPYHARYELLEFAVFTLAARAQRLVPLHAACVSSGNRGVLLMGSSGAGKSTVSLFCLRQGLDFVAEDSVFVQPETLEATGTANFLHVTDESVRWLESVRESVRIRRSPVIRRRSGVAKYEVDLRRGGHRLAQSPPTIAAVVFLSKVSASKAALRRMPADRFLPNLEKTQAYASNQPEWPIFAERLSQLPAYELRRGPHPQESAELLAQLLGATGACLGDHDAARIL